jgi:hypothetical protein
MFYENHEILGTDKPIFRKKSDEHFTKEELLMIFKDELNDFELVGYTLVSVNGKSLFQAIYGRLGTTNRYKQIHQGVILLFEKKQVLFS